MDLDSLNQQYFDREQKRSTAEPWCAHTTDCGVVTSAHYLASAAGAEMLRNGGNAFDAAIATSFTLSVCEPAGSGLGGMAMMLVYLADQNSVITIEGPCLAPQKATPELVAKSNRYRGCAAIAVPTHVATMHYVHHRYGTLPLKSLMQPAIQIAQEGFPVTLTLNRLMEQYRSALSKQSGGAIFLKGGQPYPAGRVLRQPALAETLQNLVTCGLEDFYLGEIGRKIIRDIREGGGFLDDGDFEYPPQPIERKPIVGQIGRDVVNTLGPPGGGLALVQLSQMFTGLQRESLDLENPKDVVLLARMIQRVRKERQRYRLKHLADAPGEASRLMDPTYNHALVAEINRDEISNGETSHISIVDRWGNGVAMTQSIERSFGAGVATPELGFCYNGYLRAFKVQNRRHPYYLRPGVPARSNASPTIVTRDGKPHVLIGSTGSERMVSGIFCTLMRLRSVDPFTASHGARLHCTPEGIVVLEGERFPESVREALSSRGFQLDVAEPYAFRMGGLQLIYADDDGVTGVAEPRRDGAAMIG